MRGKKAHPQRTAHLLGRSRALGRVSLRYHEEHASRHAGRGKVCHTGCGMRRTLTVEDAEQDAPLAGLGERDAGMIPRPSISSALAKATWPQPPDTLGPQSRSHLHDARPQTVNSSPGAASAGLPRAAVAQACGRPIRPGECWR